MKMKKITISSVLVTLFALTSCAHGQGHNVTLSATHGTWRGNQIAYENEDYRATFMPDEGYMLDEAAITVKINQERAVGCYTFDNNVLTISKDYVLGNIEIKARPYLIPYHATIRVGNAIPTYNEPCYHQQFDVTFKTTQEYRLPNAMKVFVNDEELTEGVGYEYVIDESRLSIFPEYVNGDILITSESVKLATLTFNGAEGTWDDSAIKTVYIDKDTPFSEVEASAGIPKVADNSLTFDHWTFNDGSSISPDYPVQDGDEFKAAYVPSKFRVHVTDTYFPDDLYKELVEYHKEFSVAFAIAEEDRNSRCLPDTVEVSCEYMGIQQAVPYEYRKYNAYEGEVIVREGNVIGDVQIKMATPILANVSFSVGEGTWDVERLKTDDVSVTLPTDKTYTLLEAWRFAQRDELGGITNDPISNDNNKVFVGWIKDDEQEISNVNGEVRSSAHYTAVYETRKFENDTWENVMLAANAGLDFLFDTYNTSEQKIIGATRNIIIGNSEIGYSQQPVRVIDVRHDILSDAENENDTTALTFEFCNTFYEMPFGTDRVYKDSSVRKALNENLVDSIPVFKELESQMTTIRSVKKSTNIPEEGIVTTDDKCFLLSASEMSLNSNDMPGKAEVISEEGEPYTYHRNHPSEDDRIKDHSPFIKSQHYWLRSEEHTLSTDVYNGYAINDEGKVYTLLTTDVIGVAPAFAIGLADHASHKGQITTNNCVCTSHEEGEFNIADDERGFVRDIVFKADDGYLFKDENDAAISVAPENDAEANITSVDISDDHKILKCSIAYNELAASATNLIKLSVAPTQSGYAGTVNLNRCTSESGVTGFVVKSGEAGTVSDTFTTKHGYLFMGDIAKDVKMEGAGTIQVSSYKYSSDNSILELTVSYDATAATGNIVITVGATMEGYVGTIDFDDDRGTSDRSSFPIERGRESMPSDNLTFSITTKTGFYYNEYDPTLTLSYECDTVGGEVEFSDVTYTGGTITFTISYNLTASYGAIHIKANPIAPYKLELSITSRVKSVSTPSFDLIPGRALAETNMITAYRYSNFRTPEYNEFEQPWENNLEIKEVVEGGTVTIRIDSNSTRTELKFYVSCDAIAACGNARIVIDAVPSSN